MLGVRGQFGATIAGGMFTVLKVRENAPTYDDPGWYDFPEGTVSRRASDSQLNRDGIELPPA
jgi:hypothetical protein